MNSSEIIKLYIPLFTYRISYSANVDFTNKSIFKVSMSHFKWNVKYSLPFTYMTENYICHCT
jgi:hypothetical protein